MRSSHPSRRSRPSRRHVERLSAADLSNLVFEHGWQVYTIALVGVLEADSLLDEQGRPDVVRLRRVLGPRVAAVAQLNRRVFLTRWAQGLPVWLDCPADLTRHVRPGPALDGEEALVALCGRLLGRPLPRDRPLWDLMLCAGPGPGQATVALRLHHALADGVAGVQIMRALFDPGHRDPDDRSAAPDGVAQQPVSRVCEPAPTGRELVHAAARDRITRTASALRHPGRWPAWLRMMARGAVRTVVIARGGMAPTSLLGPIGGARTVRVVTADLDRVRAAAHGVGGTVNDVLLGAVAQATVALLAGRGERVPECLPVSVPVSLRDENRSGTAGNEVGVMLVRLPLGDLDPGERVRRVAVATRQAKAQARRAGTLELTRNRWGIRAMDVFSRRQRAVGMFVTNVPGPASELRLDGARLLRAVPLSIIAGDVRISVAALSYAGVITVTTTFDADSCPDADVFADALGRGLSRASAGRPNGCR